MIGRVYDAGGRISSWVGNNAGVVLTFVIGQAITGIVFLTLLAGRVTTIETRGSPEVVMLERRLAAMETGTLAQDKQLANIDVFNAKLTALDVRLTAVEVKQANVLETLKSNGDKLDRAVATVTNDSIKIDRLMELMNGHIANDRNRSK